MINNIGIIGCGKLGIDIFNYLSGFPFQITLVCKSSEKADKLNSTWLKKQKRSLKHGLQNQNSYNNNLSRISFSTEIKDLFNVDLLIESITEDMGLKSELFKELGGIISKQTLFVSNTSSIPLAKIVPSQQRSDKFFGLHFFYPVSLKNLVELNITHNTSQETIEAITEFLDKINKFYIVLGEDNNYLINKLFMKVQAGAFNLHIEENIPIEDLDELVKEILFPIGIFELFDQVGIDVIYTSVLNYTQKMPDKSFYHPWLSGMKNLLNNGNLGVKSGKGFYDYTLPHLDKKEISLQGLQKNNISNKLYEYYLEPVFEAINSGLCTKEQIEHIVKEYMDCDKSPFMLAKEIGYQKF